MNKEPLHERSEGQMIENVGLIKTMAIRLQGYIQQKSVTTQKLLALLDLKLKEQQIIDMELKNVANHPGNPTSNAQQNEQFKNRLENIIDESGVVQSNFSMAWNSLCEVMGYHKDFVRRNGHLLDSRKVTQANVESQYYPVESFVNRDTVGTARTGSKVNHISNQRYNWTHRTRTDKTEATGFVNNYSEKLKRIKPRHDKVSKRPNFNYDNQLAFNAPEPIPGPYSERAKLMAESGEAIAERVKNQRGGKPAVIHNPNNSLDAFGRENSRKQDIIISKAAKLSRKEKKKVQLIAKVYKVDDALNTAKNLFKASKKLQKEVKNVKKDDKKSVAKVAKHVKLVARARKLLTEVKRNIQKGKPCNMRANMPVLNAIQTATKEARKTLKEVRKNTERKLIPVKVHNIKSELKKA